jgi:hypothetical protein
MRDEKFVLCKSQCCVWSCEGTAWETYEYRLEINIRTVIKQTLWKLVYWILLPHTVARLAKAGDGFQILHSAL